ncbi:MAG: (Fe-S)-binding protein [Chloroflexota bacterium]|nr:(Fe-S)-binding protein [Chloroflexota bacterium]
MTEQNEQELHLKSTGDVTYQCLRCAFCFDLSWLGPTNLCPSYVWGSFESYGARGRIAIARAILEGELEYDESLIPRVFACTECRACAEHCFKYIDTVAIYARMREDMAERGLIPPQLAATADILAEKHNIYDKPHEQRLSWLKDRSRVDKPAPVAFFVGCTPSYVRRTLARDTYAVLDASGLDFTVLSDEWCCGHPFLSAGQRERAAEVMRHNVEALKELRVERVVFECPGCMRTFREDAPEVLGEPLPFEVVHVTEELARQVEAGRLQFDVYQPGAVVTYHDPCTLGRGLGIYDAPRTIIEAMPGMRLAEMNRHGRDAYCCGAGSFVRYDFAEFTDKTGAERFHEAESTGAQVVLTACPACVTQLQYIRAQLESQVKVMDLVSLVNRIGRWR